MTTINAAIGATPTTAQASGGSAPVAGPRELLHFGFPNIAAGDNATPASSTPVLVPFCGVTTIPAGMVMMCAGSVTGLAVNLTAAASGSAAIFGVYKNGTIINAAAIVTIAIAGTKAYLTFASGTYTFVPGDVLDVRVRTGTGWDVLTTDCACAIEIETLT